MQQYRVEFFENHYSDNPSERRIQYVHHDFCSDITIDDDYIAAQATTLAIGATDKVKTGQFIRILRDEDDYFFGVVSDASPGKYTTTITFKPFVSLFDEPVLFDTLLQYRGRPGTGTALEIVLRDFIDAMHISNDDHLQCYPFSIRLPEDSYLTKEWNMNIQSDTEGMQRAIIGLYSVLLVRAMKEYGIALKAVPDFSEGTIEIIISRLHEANDIDADLDNVTVKTFKVNDRPNGINKLIVYNTENYLDEGAITFYAHRSDRSWGPVDEDRIAPVVYGMRSATPDGTFVDPADDFYYAAWSVAYEEFGNLTWDNLIELDCAPNDPIINPKSIRIGQEVTVYYKDGAYSSIVTGKTLSFETVTLIFGTERIKYTKKRQNLI